MISSKELVFWQWDTDRIIHLNEKGGLTIDKVEFGYEGLEPFTFTPDRTGSVPIIKVPDEFLQHDLPFIIYLRTVDELGNRTVKKYTCTVKKKEKPANYAYTPTEVKDFDDLEKRIILLEETGGTGVDLSPYRTASDQDVIDNQQNDRITALENAPSTEVDLSEYRTATQQDAIDNEQNERITALEEAGSSGSGGTTDYDALDNIPVKNLTSTSDNRVSLRDLESGVYRLSGSVTPYVGSNVYFSFSANQLVNVITKTAGTHVQIFYPIDNTVQFVSIMVDDTAESGYTYERINVKLNDLQALISTVGSLEGLETTDKTSIVAAINEVNSNFVNGTVVSENADFAEVGEWADGNPNAEDRTGYFVSVNTSEPGKTMVKSMSDSDVRGVTIAQPAFSANASKDKYDADGNLLAKYNYVCFAGFATVIDNGTCTVNGKCMPADDGTAVPSSNNFGYQVIERIDDTHILVLVEPQADMMVRIKEAVTEINSDLSIIQNTSETKAQNGKVWTATENGADWMDGVTPNIQIGTVETLDAGSNATASITGTPENPLLNLGIPKGADGTSGKSAYQYAQDGGYTGTETEFATKLAEEIPDTLPNPKALTFTGAVTGSYDGSEPLTVEIPSGGGGSGGAVSWKLIRTINIVSGTSVYSFDADNNGNAFKIKNFLILIDTYPTNGYLEIKPNGSFSFMQKPSGNQSYPFSFMMKRLTDMRYILENSISSQLTFERKISGEYSSFGEFTSFSFWFSGAPVADTTMYILGEDV